MQNYGTTDGSIVWAYSPCHPNDHDPAHQNEAWRINANGTITEIMTGKCLDTLHSTAFSQSPIVINDCNGAPTQQVRNTVKSEVVEVSFHALARFAPQWTYDSSTKLIRSGVAVCGCISLWSMCITACPMDCCWCFGVADSSQGWCLDVGATRNPYVDPCSLEPAKSMSFCDTSLPLETRVADLVANLTLDEKLGLFANGADGIPRLNIWDYQWWSEALHGVANSPGVSFGGNITAATSFPQVCGGLAASIVQY